MARLNRGPNGPFSGKVGSVIGSSWRQIYYIKGLQKKSNKERSPLQIEQQNKFALAVSFLSPIKPLVDMGFSKVNPGGATGYNMAISHMLNHCINGSDPNLSIDYSSVVLTKGKLPLPEKVSMEFNGTTLKLIWSTELVDFKSFETDTVKLLVHYPHLFQFQTPQQSFTRAEGKATIDVDTSYGGDIAHIYFYLLDDRDKRWSNSLYVGDVKLK